MELDAKYSSDSAWSNGWKNPRLDSPTGFHNSPGSGESPHWWRVDMPIKEGMTWEIDQMSLMRRGDGCCGSQQRTIDAVSFEYSNDGKTWKPHYGGKWYKTGQKKSDTIDVENQFAIDPPIRA